MLPARPKPEPNPNQTKPMSHTTSPTYCLEDAAIAELLVSSIPFYLSHADGGHALRAPLPPGFPARLAAQAAGEMARWQAMFSCQTLASLLPDPAREAMLVDAMRIASGRDDVDTCPPSKRPPGAGHEAVRAALIGTALHYVRRTGAMLLACAGQDTVAESLAAAMRILHISRVLAACSGPVPPEVATAARFAGDLVNAALPTLLPFPTPPLEQAREAGGGEPKIN
jgi:hypothetical protein